MRGEQGKLGAEGARSLAILRWTAWVSAGMTVGIALLALAGWTLDRWILARLHAGYIPMAPSTALAFLLLGGATGLLGGGQVLRVTRRVCLAASVSVCLFAAFVLTQAVAGVDVGLERWLTATYATFGSVPVGRMSPITAANFLVAGLALLALAVSAARWGWAHDVAGSLAGGVIAVGLLVLLGYAAGTPPLHGGSIIPVALPTAVAFVTLGVALLAAAGPHARTLRSYRAVGLGLMVGVVSSVLVFAIVDRLEVTRIQSEFQRRANVIAVTLRLAIDAILEDAEEIEGLFAATGVVDRLQFRTYASKSLSRHAGLQALAWSPRVPGALRPAYEAAARRDGLPGFRFTERVASSTLAAAAPRAEYAVVYYIEPPEENGSALGYDLASDPVGREALERARDSGEVAATGPTALIHETGTYAGVMTFLPIYKRGTRTGSLLERRQALRGFAVAFIRVGELVEASLLGTDREGIEVVLQDVTAASAPTVLYTSVGERVPERGRFAWNSPLDVAGRRWLVELHLTSSFLAAQQTWLPWGVLGGGLFLTVILAGYLLSSARHTAEIREAERALTERTLQLEAVRAVTGEITRELDLPTLLGLITQRAAQLVGAFSGTVFLWDEGAQVLVPKAWHGFGEWGRTVQRRLGEGVAGTVALRRGGMMVNDYRTSPYAHPEALERTEITAVLGEPLLYRNSLLGVLTLDMHGGTRSFTEQDRETLALFADHAAIAIENARLFRQEQKRVEQLDTVRTVATEVTRELELPTLLRMISRRAAELLSAGTGAVVLWDEPVQLLVPAAWHGHDDWFGEIRWRLGEGVVGTVAQRREGLVANDYRNSPHAQPLILLRTEITAVLAEPLLYRDRLLGVVTVGAYGEGRTFTDHDRYLLSLFASHAAIAIENARLHEAAVQQAQHLRTLHEVARSLTQTLDLEQVAQEIVTAIHVLIPGAAGQLWERVENSEALRLISTVGVRKPGEAFRHHILVGEGLAGAAAAGREGVISGEVTRDPRFVNRDWAASEGLVSAIGLPLLHEGHIVGALVIFTRTPHTFVEQEIDFLNSFAAHAAIAFENARLHEAAQHHASDLEARVKERTAELEEALRVKAEFLARMSHELRTPLNFVLGFAELLKQGTGGPLSGKQAQFVDRIHSGGKHLLDLVSDLLDLSLAEASPRRLQLETVSLPALVREVLELYEVQATQKRLTLTDEIPPELEVVAEGRKLFQILANLVGNGVKFTPEGGRVTVRAFHEPAGSGSLGAGSRQPAGGSGQEREGRGPEAVTLESPSLRAASCPLPAIVIEVADTGIGLAAHDLERIFRGFEQVDASPTRKYGGAGIGLALVRGLVELHGGRVWAESAGLAQGARFVVRLPLLDAPKAKRILVVEDEAVILRTVGIFLRDAGYIVEGVGTGTAALASLAARPPDLIVLDIGLPDMSGWEILKRVRSEEQTQGLPVLVLTGLGEAEAAQAVAFGASEFLTKPVSPRVLTGILGDILAGRVRTGTGHGSMPVE